MSYVSSALTCPDIRHVAAPIVTSGFGYVQTWGEPAREIRAGDVVCIPAHEKHWHGASATTAMTHIAI